MNNILLFFVLLIAFTAVMYLIGYFLFMRIFPRDKHPEKTLERFLKKLQKRGSGHVAARIKKDLAWLDETEHEEVTIKSFDKKTLYARFYANPDPCGKTVILLHGYRSSAAFDFGSQCPFLFSLGCNLLAVDQRAHGKSEGEYCSLGVAERFDATEWSKWVEEKLGENEGVVLYGASMGATTALLASAEEEDLPENVIGIIADSAYIGPMMQLQNVMRSHRIPVSMFINIIEIFCMSKGRFSIRDCTTTNAMPKCLAPVLFIHGENDRLVPHDDSRINHEQCAARNEFVLIPGAEHTRAYITDEAACQEAISSFLDSLEGPPSPERALRAAESEPEYDDEDDYEDEYEDDEEYEDEYEDEEEDEYYDDDEDDDAEEDADSE